MRKIKNKYIFIKDIIEATNSILVKNLILDNIFTIVTPHRNPISEIFQKYYLTGLLTDAGLLTQKTYRFKKCFLDVIRLPLFLLKQFLKKPIVNLIKHYNRIFLIYIPNNKYLDLGMPLYDKLKNKGNIKPIIIYNSSNKLNVGSNYNIINLSDYRISYIKIFDFIKKVLITKRDIKEESKFYGFYYYIFDQLWYSQLINLINKHKLQHLFSENTDKICGIFSCIPTDNFSRSIHKIAKVRKIPTFSVRRGVTFNNLENYFIETDFLFAKGKYEKEIYKEIGIDKRMRIEIVGAPFLEKLNHFPNKYSDASKNIFFVDQPLSEFCDWNCRFEIVNLLGKTCKKFENIKLLIKLHPGTKKANIYKKIFDEIDFEKFLIYKSDFNLHNVLIDADYVLIMNSTVGYNALLYKKPLLVFGNHFFSDDIENIFNNREISFIVENSRNFEEIIKEISSNSLRSKKNYIIEKFLEYHLKYLGDNSVDKAVAFINKVI